MSCRTKIILLLVLAAFTARQAAGSSGAAPRGPALQPFHEGQNIVVKMHKGLGKPLKGAFLAADADSVQLRQKDGSQLAVPWESIRKITPRRSWGDVLIGVVTGAAWAGFAVLSSEGDVGGGWSAGVTGLGAGAGAAAAIVGGPVEGALYEAPNRESDATAPPPADQNR